MPEKIHRAEGAWPLLTQSRLIIIFSQNSKKQFSDDPQVKDHSRSPSPANVNHHSPSLSCQVLAEALTRQVLTAASLTGPIITCQVPPIMIMSPSPTPHYTNSSSDDSDINITAVHQIKGKRYFTQCYLMFDLKLLLLKKKFIINKLL